MNVYAMNDDDWFVGESLESCVAAYIEYCGDPDLVDDPYELSEEQLLSHTYFSEDDDENGHPVRITFKQQLQNVIADGGEFPRLFASTEY